jgi:hypothetical protein
MMKPITQITGNMVEVYHRLDEDLKDTLIEMPDIQDAYIIECETCGTLYVAKWKAE